MPLVSVPLGSSSATGLPQTQGATFFMKEIKLSLSKYGQMYACVDDEDFDFLNKFKWFPHNRGTVEKPFFYAARGKRINGNHTMISMHREIMNVKSPNVLIDHEDHDTLNNQKINLRIATKRQNQINRTSMIGSTSKYLGVSLRNDTGKWTARIKTKDKYETLGSFFSEKQAALAYNNRAKEVHCEFANLNKI